MNDEHFTAVIDARGLSCPLPLLKARQALMLLEPGDTILVLATDPEAERDFDEFAEASGHELLAIDPVDDALRISLRKAMVAGK